MKNNNSTQNNEKQKNNKVSNQELAFKKAMVYPIVKFATEAGMKLTQEGSKFLVKRDNTEHYLLLDPKKNNFKCSRCGSKGNVINLAMLIYGVDIDEAIEILNN